MALLMCVLDFRYTYSSTKYLKKKKGEKYPSLFFFCIFYLIWLTTLKFKWCLQTLNRTIFNIIMYLFYSKLILFFCPKGCEPKMGSLMGSLWGLETPLHMYRYQIECNNIGWDSLYHLSLRANSGPPENCEVGTYICMPIKKYLTHSFINIWLLLSGCLLIT